MKRTLDVILHQGQTWLWLQEGEEVHLVVHDANPIRRRAGIEILERQATEGIISQDAADTLCGWLALVRPADLWWEGATHGR